MSAFPVEAIRSVEIDVPDLDAAVAFYTDVWGLIEAHRDERAVWLRGSGRDCYLLGVRMGGAAIVRSVTYRAAADTDLDALSRRIEAAGGTIVEPPGCTGEPGGGTLLVATDPRGRTVRIVQNDARADPLDLPPDRPERLAHVNINSVATDADCDFFVDGLGFALTDRSKIMGFVRTNSDHHTVVIADAAVNTLNHIAFQMRDWEGVMRASGRMIDHGFPIGWGPGRHGPGNNVFAYFVDPFGIVVEYTAEVLQVDAHYRVGGPDDWVWPEGRTDQWGIAPPKSEACKAAQLAIPYN